MRWRTPALVAIALSYWAGMAAALGFALLVGGLRCLDICDEEGRWQLRWDAPQWTVIQVLAVVAFLAAVAVFALRGRRRRAIAFGVHLAVCVPLGVLVAAGLSIWDNHWSQGWPLFLAAFGGELVAALGVALSAPSRTAP